LLAKIVGCGFKYFEVFDVPAFQGLYLEQKIIINFRAFSSDVQEGTGRK
jgi:hypothetical protein